MQRPLTATQKVERAAAKAAVARERLESAICDAHVSGESLRAIAEAAGVSHEQVRRIVREYQPATDEQIERSFDAYR